MIHRDLPEAPGPGALEIVLEGLRRGLDSRLRIYHWAAHVLGHETSSMKIESAIRDLVRSGLVVEEQALSPSSRAAFRYHLTDEGRVLAESVRSGALSLYRPSAEYPIGDA